MSKMNSLEARVARELSGGRLATHAKLLEMGVPKVSISRLVERDFLIRTARGYYVLSTEWDGDPLPALAARFGGEADRPNGVICLQMAAHLHGLTDLTLHNIPRPEVAIPFSVKRAGGDRLKARVIKLRTPYGLDEVEWREFGGHGIHVTSPSRTVCDLFAPWAKPLPEGMAHEALARLMSDDETAARRSKEKAVALGWGQPIGFAFDAMRTARRFADIQEEILPEEGGRFNSNKERD